MDVCICAGSAVEFWRAWRLAGPAAVSGMGFKASQRFTQSWRSCILAGQIPVFGVPSPRWTERIVSSEFSRISVPVDYLATQGGRLSTSDIAVSRLYSLHIAPTDIVAINDHVYVTTPEFSILTALQGCNRVEMLRIANEFCGTFAVDLGSPKGFRPAAPLTSRGSLIQFCNEHSSWKRILRFRSAMTYALDNCASPAESSTVLLLCLPVHDGGYNLPLPEMSSRIVPDAPSSKYADRSYYVGDAVWRDGMTIVEYDSKAFHSEQDSVTHDHIRKLALESAGYHVSVVTPNILVNPVLFEKVALDTARRLGRRHRVRVDMSEYRAKQREMREVLLSVPNAWYQSWNAE